MNETISIVVPFYNEEENAPILFKQTCDALNEKNFECIFVNDGSTDSTGDVLDALAKNDPRLTIVHMDGNFGQSAALVAGMRQAKNDFIFTLDGDLQNDPIDIPAMAEKLCEYDCVFGVRANRQDNAVRRISSRVANLVRNAILHDGISDSGCGTKGFRRECVEQLVCFNGLHRFLAVFLRKAGYSIIEHNVTHHHRQFGVSKYGVHNRLWRGLYDLVGVRWLAKRQVLYRVKKSTPE